MGNRNRSALAALVDALAVAATIVACLAAAPQPADTTGTPPDRPDRRALIAAIDGLLQAEPSADGAYDRAEFPHWIEVTSGCDTRCAVLDRQRSPGGWLSVYDGFVATTASDLEIDHVVPLAEAWVSGASSWTVARRQAFANDLTSGELLAVSAWSNRDKGAGDPAVWRPPNPDWWCWYVHAWVGVKLDWALSADRAELAALRTMTSRC